MRQRWGKERWEREEDEWAEPKAKEQAQGPPTRDKICRNWEQTGQCAWGSACWYAHGPQEIGQARRATTPVVVKKPSGWGFWVEKRQDKAKKEEEVPIEEGPRVGRTGPPRSGGSKGQGVNAHQATSPYNFRFRWEPPPRVGGRRWCRRVGEEARWIAQGQGTRPSHEGPSSAPIEKQDEDLERGPERGPSASTLSSIFPEHMPEQGQVSCPSETHKPIPT